MNSRFPGQGDRELKVAQMRAALKAEFTEHVRGRADAISALLFRCDPLKVNIGTNSQAYDDVAREIVPCMIECRSDEDVLRVVHQKFSEVFGSKRTGLIKDYTAIASAIWLLWKSKP
jgi:hypothetical protein